MTVDQLRRSIPAVLEVAAAVSGYSVEDLVGRHRGRRLAIWRNAAMLAARRLTSASYPEIGRAFGGRDHTTVMSACGVKGRPLSPHHLELAEVIASEVRFREELGQQMVFPGLKEVS